VALAVHSDKTRYGQGTFPWELRAKAVRRTGTDFTPELDWETLFVADDETVWCA
jgi:hypothetical protein